MTGTFNMPPCEFATTEYIPCEATDPEPVVEIGVSDNPLSPRYVEPLTDDAQKRSVADFVAIGDMLCEAEKTLGGGLVGWVCPVCGRGIAPGEAICPCRPGAPYNFPPQPQDYPTGNPWWKPLIPPIDSDYDRWGWRYRPRRPWPRPGDIVRQPLVVWC